VQFCLKIGGPPSKFKYIFVNDSKQVPRGKGEKNPYKGVKRLWNWICGAVVFKQRTFCIMGQLVYIVSKLRCAAKAICFKRAIIVNNIRPETKWSSHGQVEVALIGLMEDWTRTCRKILGWAVIRGERLIKLGDSWFSAKSI